MAAPPKLPGEFALIDRYFRPLAGDPGAFGLADDAALLAPPHGEEIVATVDAIAEGVHFFADDPPEAIAAKALRVNLSDLAAKGAAPRSYLLMLALGPGRDEAWVAGFAAGLAADQARYGVTLLGGDTIRASATTISVTAFGTVPAGFMVHRRGAAIGDALFVSGTIGDAALGLRLRLGKLVAGEGASHLLRRYLYPEPRIGLAAVVRRYASAAMDISDGLIGDLGHLCAASGVSAMVEAGDVPLSTAARRAVQDEPASFDFVLGGGDDYEILAAVPEDQAGAFAADAAAAGVPVSRIGAIVAGAEPPSVMRGGKRLDLARRSYDHFGN